MTVYCENEAANLILSSFADRAKAQGIPLAVHAVLPNQLPLAESDLCVLLSNVMTQEEAAFLTFIRIFGIAWSGVLVFTGFMSIHQFSFSKTVLSILLTLVGIAIMIFLAILFVGLMQQVVSFIQSICSELIIMM